MHRITAARLTACFAALLAVAGCGESPDADPGQAAPPLYEIASSDGEVEGWLLGTIHALPADTKWRTPQVQSVIDEADEVVVEIAGLDDRDALQAVFQRLAYSPGQPLLVDRVDAELRPELNALIARSERESGDFRGIETWAAALILAQVSAQGDPDYGVDRSVIREFEGRSVIEFEGAEAQLGIFDSLAEQDQRDLLGGVIAETRLVDHAPGELRKAWLFNDQNALIQATETGIMADPELRQALLVQRNLDWLEQLVPMLDRNAQPLVAVGAAHLVGPDGLIAMLESRGYSVRPLH